MDGYRIGSDAVQALAATAAAQRQPVAAAATPLQQVVAALSTGDPGLDAQTRAVAAQVAELHALMGAVLGELADALRDAATGYRAGDDEVAATYRGLLADEPPAS